MNTDQMLAYIAAFVDGEGHIGCHQTSAGHFTRSICVTNTEKCLIDKMNSFLLAVGFETRIHFDGNIRKTGWKPKWTLYIAGGRRSFNRFKELIPLQSEKKQNALNEILRTYEQTDAKISSLREAIKTNNTTPCLVCSKPVFATAAKRKNGGGKFCSHACRGIASQTRMIKPCAQCNTPFTTVISKHKNAMFCSLSCYGKSKGERMAALAKIGAAARWQKSTLT